MIINIETGTSLLYQQSSFELIKYFAGEEVKFLFQCLVPANSFKITILSMTRYCELGESEKETDRHTERRDFERERKRERERERERE